MARLWGMSEMAIGSAKGRSVIMTQGDIYQLKNDLGEIPSGVWAVVEIGMMVTLSRVGEDEDGSLCTTCRLVKVTRDEMERVEDMGLRVALLDAFLTSLRE